MTTPAWWCLQHVDAEGPALVGDVLRQRGTTLHVCRPDRGEALPPLGDLAGLVVLGGPMHALDDAAHPYLRAERDLLAGCVDAAIPVLGICLGAQLLAAALGASVTTGDAPEIGPGTVRLGPAGRCDPVLRSQPEIPVVHWHEDTFTLPAGATLLASSDQYPHQAFRAGPVAYGLQFHVELGPTQFDVLAAAMPAPLVPSVAQLAEVARSGIGILSRFADLAGIRADPDKITDCGT